MAERVEQVLEERTQIFHTLLLAEDQSRLRLGESLGKDRSLVEAKP